MTGELIIPKMTWDETEQAINEVKNYGRLICARLYELYIGQAWVARGFANWGEFAHDAFGVSSGWSYKLVNAAEVASNIEILPGENLAVKHAELLRSGLKDDPVGQKAAYQLAQSCISYIGQPGKLGAAVKAAITVTQEMIITKGNVSVDGESVPATLPLADGMFAANAAVLEQMNEALKKTGGDARAHSVTLLSVKGRIQQAGDSRVLIWVSGPEAVRIAEFKRNGHEEVILVIKEKANDVIQTA
jgi:hypothetical protein